MAQHPLYHLHRQNRLVKIRKPLFPAKWIKVLDVIAMCVAVLGPILTIPQIYKVWFESAEGLSLITWCSYLLFNTPMLIYGIAHRDKVMTLMSALWMLVNASIVSGILFRG